jgi:hypothetical protein
VQEVAPGETGETAETGEKPVSPIDPDWLREQLAILEGKLEGWSKKNVLSYIKVTYKITAKDVLEAVCQMDKGQAAHFTKHIQDAILALCVLMFLLGMAYERVTTVAVLYHPPPSETITDNFSIEIGQEMDIPKY